MSFNETILYAAVCDDCGDEAMYDDPQFGELTKEDAIKYAIGGIYQVGDKVLCHKCRPCERCGDVNKRWGGGVMVMRPGGSLFLCCSCNWRLCGRCGHSYGCHNWHNAPSGAVITYCYSDGPCNCIGFAEPEPVSTQPETETTK